MNREVRYTTIQHEPRLKLGLSNNDYCIADSIFHLSNHPDHRICEKSLPELAAFIGVERRTLVNITKKLGQLNLIEKVKDGSRHLGHRPTEQWYDLIEQHRLNLDQEGNGFRYTTVLHPPRLHLGISINAYCIADSIYRLSNRPGHPNCTASLKNLGAFIGISEKSANNLKNTLIKLGLVEKVASGARHLGYRTTDLWYREVVTFTPDRDREKSSASPVDPVQEGEKTGREKSSVLGKKVQSSKYTGKKVQPSKEESSAGARKKIQPSREKSSDNTDNKYSNTNKQQQQLFEKLGITKRAQDSLNSKYDSKLIVRMLEELEAHKSSVKTTHEAWLTWAIEAATRGDYQFQETPNQKRKKLEEKRRSEELAKEAEEAAEQEQQLKVDQWIQTHPREYDFLLSNNRENTPSNFRLTANIAEGWAKSNTRLTIRRILSGEESMPSISSIPSPPPQPSPETEPRFQRRRIKKKDDQPQGQLSLLAA